MARQEYDVGVLADGFDQRTQRFVDCSIDILDGVSDLRNEVGVMQRAKRRQVAFVDAYGAQDCADTNIRRSPGNVGQVALEADAGNESGEGASPIALAGPLIDFA